MAQLILKRGNYAGLSDLTITDGQLIFVKDTNSIYADIGTERIKFSDVVQVATSSALPANGNAGQICIVSDINALGFWNGTSWTQLNVDTGATSVEVTGTGNAITSASYDASTRKITLNKGETFATQADVDTLATYVGTIPNGEDGQPIVDSVIAYVNKKTEGIATSGNLEALEARVGTVEGKIGTIEGDYLKSTDKTELEGKITSAQTAADNAQLYAEGVAGNLSTHEADAVKHITAAEREAWNGKTTMADVEAKGYLVADDIAGKADKTQVATDIADAVKVETDNRVAADEAIEAKIGTVADGKTVVQMIADAQTAATYDDEEVRGLISDNADAIAAETEARGALKTELEGKIDSKVAQTDYDTKVAALDGEDARLAGLIGAMDTAYKAADAGLAERIADLESDITGLSGAMHFKGVVDALPETTDGYNDGDTIIVGQKEYVVNGEAFVELGDVSAEVQRITDLEGVVGNAESGLVKGVADNAAAIAAEKDRAEAKEAELVAADATNLQAAKDYADDAVEALNIAQYAKQTDLDGAVTRIGTAEGKIADLEAASATHALKTEVEAVSKELGDYKTAHAGDYTNAQVDAAVKVVADDLKAYEEAHASDYTNEQINAAIANAGHASAADLATHTGNADIHVTTDDKAKWNAAEQNAKDYTDAQVEAAKTDASNKDTVVLAEAQKAVTAAKTELQLALDTYKLSNDPVVAGKADKATTLSGYGITDAYTKTQVEAMLTWGEF